jgi:hypothetical protein
MDATFVHGIFKKIGKEDCTPEEYKRLLKSQESDESSHGWPPKVVFGVEPRSLEQ